MTFGCAAPRHPVAAMAMQAGRRLRRGDDRSRVEAELEAIEAALVRLAAASCSDTRCRSAAAPSTWRWKTRRDGSTASLPCPTGIGPRQMYGARPFNPDRWQSRKGWNGMPRNAPTELDAPRVAALDDEDALVAAARRDRRAFAPLYRRRADAVHRYCFRRLGNRADAEDATSLVITKALAGLDRYRAGSVSRLALRHRRQRRRRSRPRPPTRRRPRRRRRSPPTTAATSGPPSRICRTSSAASSSSA